MLLTTAHAAHEGIQKTLCRLRRDFHLPGAKRLVQEFVKACLVCQRNKTEHLHPAGLLQPLEVPYQPWSDITMDFIEGLPRVHGKSVILSVIDRFSKYAHFIPLAHPYSATTVARVFFDEIVRLHGIPTSIVSDQDPVFTSNFWQDLFRLAGVRTYLSSAYHPQSDGQTEAVNKVIAMYLRCLTGDRPRQWLGCLPWAEYCYNTSYHSALRETPFKVVYGRDAPSLRTYAKGEAVVPAVEDSLLARDKLLCDIRDRLLQAQGYAKKYYDKNHREVSFAIGELVWLRLLHRSAASLGDHTTGKLAPKLERKSMMSFMLDY